MAHHKAAAEGHVDIVDFLQEKVPRLKAQVDSDGNTAEDIAQMRNPIDIQALASPSLVDVNEKAKQSSTVVAVGSNAGEGSGFDCPSCSERVYSGRIRKCCRMIECEGCAKASLDRPCPGCKTVRYSKPILPLIYIEWVLLVRLKQTLFNRGHARLSSELS